MKKTKLKNIVKMRKIDNFKTIMMFIIMMMSVKT